MVPCRDLVFPWLGKSFSRPPCGVCFRSICSVLDGLLRSSERCRCVQEYAVLTIGPTMDLVHIPAVESDVGVLLVLLPTGVLWWPARWRSGSSAQWPSSRVKLLSTSSSPVNIHSIDSPGYSLCFCLVENIWMPHYASSVGRTVHIVLLDVDTQMNTTEDSGDNDHAQVRMDNFP